MTSAARCAGRRPVTVGPESGEVESQVAPFGELGVQRSVYTARTTGWGCGPLWRQGLVLRGPTASSTAVRRLGHREWSEAHAADEADAFSRGGGHGAVQLMLGHRQ